MNDRTVTVFGGTGFLGRRIVRYLREAGISVRIASRHPGRALALFGTDDPGVHAIASDVNDEQLVADAVAGVQGVVNAVSLYLERGNQTFRTVHVEAAGRIAKQARQAEVARLVHVSGIGADVASRSPYIRSRGEGEVAVQAAFPGATIVRPAVMFGPDDAFLVPLLTMLRRLPAFPMFGAGETRLQPAYVEDLAEAVVRLLQAPAEHRIYELAGPRLYTYQELLRTITAAAGRRPFLVPLPFVLWRAIGYVSEFLPSPPISANQVDLMERDNIAASDSPGFRTLQIAPQAVETILPGILRKVEQA